MKNFSKMALVLLIFCLFPIFGYGDIGPKPSISIRFEGLEGEKYYATLLSKDKSTGPASAYDGTNAREFGSDRWIWQKFVDYNDGDDFYFLQEFQNGSESHAFNWTYYPPWTFKILLYFPERDEFVVSEIYDRYAFDSYYKVTVDKKDPQGMQMVVRKDYRFGWEMTSMSVRIVLTIAIEVLVALLFGFRTKSLLRFIALVNIITQVGLNVALNAVNYFYGSMAFVLLYLLLELIIIVAESMIYAKGLPKRSERSIKKWRITFYAICANVLSFFLGMFISMQVPGIF